MLGLIAGALLLLAVVVVAAVMAWGYRPFVTPEFLDLKGKHVVITGGSSGIGREIARICVQKGANVTIMARNQQRLDDAVQELTDMKSFSEASDQSVYAESVDVTDTEAVSASFGRAEQQVGPVDVLVCSAGATNPLYFDQLSVADFSRQIDVNFLGIVRCVKAVLPSMKQRRAGRLVLISSMVGQVGMFGYSAYSASKFAVRGFAESLYPEVLPYNVHVSVSYPPDTDTPMYEEEMRLKPIETKLMSESSSVFTPMHIARDVVGAIEHHTFNICHGFDGSVLRCLASGLQPPQSFLSLIFDVLCLPLLRLVWVFFILSSWFKIAVKHANK